MHPVRDHHRQVGDRRLEGRRARLADPCVRRREHQQRIAEVHPDRTGIGILGAGRARDDDLQIRTRRRDARRCFAKHRPVPLHFLLPASRKQSQRQAARIESEHPARLDPRRRRRPVFEGMTDERGGDAALAEELLLERQNHRELIHRRELAHALGPPRPHLRCDIVEHRNAGGGGGSGGTEVIARVIDQDDEIVALVLERLLDPVQ